MKKLKSSGNSETISINTQDALEGVLPGEIPGSEKHSSQVVFEPELLLGEIFAGLQEHLLVVDLDKTLHTSVFLACCHQSQEVCT